MTTQEQSYLNTLRSILLNGTERPDRTGTGTYSKFGERMTFDLQEGFPLLTTRKLFFQGIVSELLWFLSGSTNIQDLPEYVRHWWEPWADEEGEVGPLYGKQMRYTDEYIGGQFARTIDQIRTLVKGIEKRPYSRRHVLSTWNVGELHKMALPPCHGLVTQFYVREGDYLDCQMYQRSGDMFIGVPNNIASYSLLTHLIAHVCGLRAGTFTHVLGDAHIYLNHRDQVWTQLARPPRSAPNLGLNPAIGEFGEFGEDDIILKDYDPHPSISAPVAV